MGLILLLHMLHCLRVDHRLLEDLSGPYLRCRVLYLVRARTYFVTETPC